MRRKYKVIIIILVSTLLTYFIYFFNKENKLNIVAIGDGVASGETFYNIDGISFNDYLKEYFESKHLLKNYNNSYAIKNLEIKDLIDDLKSNIKLKEDKLSINQIIHKADIITIAIGEEELVKKEITNDLNKESINEFIQEYDNLLYMLKEITEANIVVVGLYENSHLDKSNVIILNSELANVAIKYNVIFINISDLVLNSEYMFNKNSYYFNYKAHKEIAEMIIHSL